jgi:hypothetical protein
MKRLMIRLSLKAKVLAVFSANKDDNMDMGKYRCLGEQQ